MLKSPLLLFIYLCIGEGRKKEREKNIDVREKQQSVDSHKLPDWGRNPQPGSSPDWVLNWQHFALQDAQLTEHIGQGLL